VFACRAHRVLNFLQRDLPLFEEDDEDFELGGGGQTGAGGEAGAVVGVLSVYMARARAACGRSDDVVPLILWHAYQLVAVRERGVVLTMWCYPQPCV
jgi:hypothetical protein